MIGIILLLREQEVVQLSLAVKELSELLNRSGIGKEVAERASPALKKQVRRAARKPASGS